MPRRNKNASEREDHKWNPDYIRSLMRKIREGKIEPAYDTPVVKENKNK